MNDKTFLEQFTNQYAWAQAPAKRRFRFKKEINREMIENHRLALTLGGVIDRAIDDNEGLQSSDYSTYQIFEENDLVFKLIDLENIKTSRVGHVPRRGIMSPAYIRLERSSKHAYPRYYYWFFYGAYINNIFNGMGGGVRQNLTHADLLEFPIPLPSFQTQKGIADFLDRETSRIDQLVEKKKKVVGLLKETRNTVISKAITVGLGTTEELVETGSKYLPFIPSSWRIWRLKQLARVRGGLTLGRKVPERVALQVVPYLRVANVQAGWLDLNDVVKVSATKEEIKRFMLNKDDILMNEGGDNDKLGRGAVWHAPFAPCPNQNHVFCVRPREKKYAEWISMATNARYARDFFYLHSNQSTNLASISKSNLERFPVPIPPDDQLKDILNKLNFKLARISELNKKINLSINHLRELRSALITAAVTGQINVETWGKRGETDRRLDRIEKEMGASKTGDKVMEAKA